MTEAAHGAEPAPSMISASGNVRGAFAGRGFGQIRGRPQPEGGGGSDRDAGAVTLAEPGPGEEAARTNDVHVPPPTLGLADLEGGPFDNLEHYVRLARPSIPHRRNFPSKPELRGRLAGQEDPESVCRLLEHAEYSEIGLMVSAMTLAQYQSTPPCSMNDRRPRCLDSAAIAA